MGKSTGYHRGQRTNGQNQRFYQTGAAARKVIGQKRAPAVIPFLDHSKDKRNPAWAREAAAKVVQDQQWLKVADGYDPTCGMNSRDDWSREFMWAVFNDWYWRGCPEEPMPDVMRECLFPRHQHGVKFTCNSPQLSLEPTVKKAPVKEQPEKTNGKHPTLTLLHQRMVGQLGGDTDIMCAGDCGNSLKPRFDYAKEHGTCPYVFQWSENDKFYCGESYGPLPHKHQVEPQPLAKQPKPIEPPASRMRLKAKYTR